MCLFVFFWHNLKKSNAIFTDKCKGKHGASCDDHFVKSPDPPHFPFHYDLKYSVFECEGYICIKRT